MPLPTEPLCFWCIDHEDNDVMVATPLNEEALKALLVKYEVPERFWRVGYHATKRYSYIFSAIARERQGAIS